MSKAIAVDESGKVRYRILDVATDLSARVGLEAVSVRDIASTAQVSLSAINYHFGSKIGLMKYLVRSHLTSIDALREPLLFELENSVSPSLRDVLTLIFLPALTWMFGNEADQRSSQFFSRALVTPIAEIQQVIDENVTHLDRIVDLLERCGLGLPRAEIYSRLHFTIGIEHLSFFDLGRHKRLSNGMFDEVTRDEMLEKMLDFAEAGWRRK